MSFKDIPSKFLIAELGSMRQVNYQDALVYLGKVWTSRRILTIPVGVSNLYFNPLSANALNVPVVSLPPKFQAIGDERIEATVYLGAEYTGGANQIISNRNQNFTGSPLSVINYNGTLTVPGTEGLQFLIPSFAQGLFNQGAETEGKLLVVFDTNKITRVKLDNKGTGSAIFEYILTWAELTKD
jgi:hypothetical protein